jgi:dimethylargininase
MGRRRRPHHRRGIAQLTAHLVPFGVDVVTVPVSKALHLKSAVTALPDGTIIGYEAVIDDPRVWGETFLAVPEEPGAHVVLLDNDTLLMSAAAPRTAKLFEERGYRVIAVDISEFEKLEGCVTCLSVRLRGRPESPALQHRLRPAVHHLASHDDPLNLAGALPDSFDA